MATKRATAPGKSRTRTSDAHKTGSTGLMPNQVVAYNLARARRLRRWSQEQAAAALEPHLGKRWSKASLSQAERSVTGKVPRSFDADELVAFARAFNLPATWFLVPPTPAELSAIPGISVDLGPTCELVDLVFGDDINTPALTDRVAELFADMPAEQLTASQRRLGRLVQAQSETIGEADYRRMVQLEAQLAALTANARELTEKLQRDRDRRRANVSKRGGQRASAGR